MRRLARTTTRVIALAIGVGIGTSALAQDFPTRPIRFVLPNGAGSTTDILARIIGKPLGERLGQPIVIDPKPGANGVVAVADVAKARPDGYTLVMGSNGTYGILPGKGEKLPYDPIKDFEPVVRSNEVSYIIVVRNGLPAKTLQEFIAAAKANPAAPMSVGTTGSVAELAGLLLGVTAGVKFNSIYYKAAPQALVDLIGERLDSIIETHATLLRQIQSGQVRALAVTSKGRSALLPELPTVAETGYPGFEHVAWQGFFAPAGTPKPVVARLATELNAVLRMPEVRAAFRQNGVEATTSTPEELAQAVRAEIDKWATLFKHPDFQKAR